MFWRRMCRGARSPLHRRFVERVIPVHRDLTVQSHFPSLRQSFPGPNQIFLDTTMVRANLPLVDAYLQAGLDALADPTRMAIFQKLSAGPIPVNELARMLPVTRPAV